MRVTVSCPAAMVDDANALAMVLGFSTSDGRAYNGFNWRDAEGNLYAAASFIASDAWGATAQSPLARPEWDVSETINMEAARRAQKALMFSSEPQCASPTALTAIGGMDGLTAIQSMGLIAVEIDDEML